MIDSFPDKGGLGWVVIPLFKEFVKPLRLEIRTFGL